VHVTVFSTVNLEQERARKMWAIQKEENDFYAIRNNAKMRFSRSKYECPPLQRLDVPSKDDLKSRQIRGPSGVLQKAVIVSIFSKIVQNILILLQKS
jgi:hypothetical protein